MTNSRQNKASVGPDDLVDQPTLEQAEKIGVFDELGNERPFGGLIRHGKVCVVFIRHFLCGFCQDYVAALKRRFTGEKLGDRKLIIIGCGHWSVIKPYKELLDCPFPIYSDNTRALFDRLGMICNLDAGNPKTEGRYITQNLTNTIITSLSHGWKMGTKTFIQGGKISQLGGEFIFLDGQCVHAHRMQTTRDHTEPEDLEKRLVHL